MQPFCYDEGMENTWKKIPTVCLCLKMAYYANQKKLEGIMRYENQHGPWRIHLIEEVYTLRDLQHYANEVSGWILSFYPSREIRDFFLDSQKPIVLVDVRQNPFPETFRRCGIVSNNNDAIAEMAGEHLFATGFENIGYVHNYLSSGWSIQRRKRLEKLCREKKRPFFVFGEHEPYKEPKEGRDDDELAQWLRHLPRPVGLMVANDFRARQVLDLCFMEGIDIPGEMTVLGVDNDLRIGNISKPTLSSVEPHFEHGGWLAAKMLDKLMRGRRHNPTRVEVYHPTGIVRRRSTQTIKTSEPLVQEALEYIWNHAWKNGNVNSTARHLRISTRKLETLFRQVVGHTVLEELQNTRYQQIVRLLCQTDLPIREIARQCGLKNTSHLIQKFKERFGMTMNQFRKKHRN